MKFVSPCQFALWASSAPPVLRSVSVTTCAHVTRRQEAATPPCKRRTITPYTEVHARTCAYAHTHTYTQFVFILHSLKQLTTVKILDNF